MRIYIIRDIKAQVYQGAYAFMNDDVAKRAFSDALSQIPTVGNHPEDFQLYVLCDYDEKSAECKPCIDFVCNFTELKHGEGN